MTALELTLPRCNSPLGFAQREPGHGATLNSASAAAKKTRTTATLRASNPELVAMLSAVAGGDQRAFSALYQHTAPRLFAVAVQLLRRPELANEMVQDAFVTVWVRASDYNPALASPLVWLCAIVRNRALDQLRRPAVEVRWPEGDGDEDPLASVASDTPDPLALLISRRDHIALHSGLTALPSQYRQALALAYIEGLAHPEIAVRLQIPLGTAKTWVRRGLELLRRTQGVASASA